MFETLMIAFREGLEAFLIVAIAITYLRKAKYDALIPAVHSAIVVAVIGCAILGVVMARIGALEPLWEGTLALTAAILVISCTVHMLSIGKHLKSEINSAMTRASEKSGFSAKLAIFSFIVLMIGREGLEAATMIASLAQNNGMESLAIGGVIGIMVAGAVACAWTRYGKSINLSRFFQVTAIFMVLFSIQLVIYAFHEFTESSEVAGLGLFDSAYWHQATEPWGPDGKIGAWISYSLLLVPLGFLIVATLQDRKKATNASVSASTT